MTARDYRPASFNDLRAFLGKHAGHWVEVTVEGPDAVGFASVRAHGVLDPVSDEEQEELSRRALGAAYEYDPEWIRAQADFRLRALDGRETFELVVHSWATLNLELGEMAEVYRGDLATREWIEFTINEPQADGTTPLPDWGATVRITEYGQRSIGRLVEEMTGR